MVIQRVYGIVVTLYLALIVKDGDDFSCGCSGEKIVVSAVADHACVATSVCVIVAKLAKFRVQAATRSNEGMRTMHDGMVVFVAVEANPRFSRRALARGERRPLQRGGSSVLNEAITATPSA